MKSMPAQIIPAWQLPKYTASRGITHRPLCKYIHDDVIKMETFSALLYLCAGISPVPGEFPSQRSVTRSFDVFFDLSLNKTLIKQSRRLWFETASRSLWRHCNEHITSCCFVLTSPYAPNTFTYKYWYAISYMLLKRLLHNEIIQVIEMFLHWRQWPTYFTVSTQFFAGYFVTHEAWVVTRPCIDNYSHAL